jgi:hypothetical protein
MLEVSIAAFNAMPARDSAERAGSSRQLMPSDGRSTKAARQAAIASQEMLSVGWMFVVGGLSAC